VPRKRPPPTPNDRSRSRSYYYTTWRDDPERVARQRAQATAWRQKPENAYRKHVRDAVRRKLAWELTFEQFVLFWQEPCTYCGEAIATVGIDRVDSEVGYLLYNCVPCCATCNRMKLAMSAGDFVARCRAVVDHQDARPGRTIREVA